jgi:hypothetical protein
VLPRVDRHNPPLTFVTSRGVAIAIIPIAVHVRWQGDHGAQSFSAKPCELSTEIGICDYGLRMLGRLQLGLRSLSDFAYSSPRTILYTGFESNVGRSESSQEDHLLSARVKLLRVAIL